MAVKYRKAGKGAKKTKSRKVGKVTYTKKSAAPKKSLLRKRKTDRTQGVGALRDAQIHNAERKALGLDKKKK